MKPKLLLPQVKNLHDARYAAAVGVDFLSFELGEIPGDRGWVKDVMGWLSGPQGVGEWPATPPDISSTSDIPFGLSWVSLPLEAQPPAMNPLIFRANLVEPGTLMVLREKAQKYSDALFQIVGTLNQLTSLRDTDPSLFERSFASLPHEEEILHLIKTGSSPFGVVIGSFVLDKNGDLDYELCDAFLAKM